MSRNDIIIGLYKAGDSSQKIAEQFGVTPRQIQRIVNKAGVSRTISESFRLAIKYGRMRYHHTPEHLKHKRKTISSKLRYQVLTRYNSTCRICGRTPQDGIRIEIDHIDNDATHNTLDNLQVLCRQCNHGKAMGSMYA